MRSLRGCSALLATQGINLGPLNALSAVGIPVASVLAGVGGLILIATTAWFLQKAKTPPQQKSSLWDGDAWISDMSEKADRRWKNFEPIDKLFLSEPKADVTKTVTVQNLEGLEWTLHYKQEVTFDDVLKKVASLTDHASEKLLLYCKGKELNADSWPNVEDNATISFVQKLV